jgi:Asp-tRNA(Asn)/Glu-tRNA(Gln) amidotransferase A subunit family amidase
MIEPTSELSGLTAVAAARALRAGEISSVDLVQACLKRIAATEDSVQAWTHLDPDYALAQAKAADAAARAGAPRGPLHGLPVGIKDIIDTRDMPTENGTVLHAGRRPTADATVVSLLRQAGAVILGKTVTTELAVYAPGKTRNPHNPEHTPGGSSSGSAAAVAAGMVPLSLGTQTNGSVIRPASFCGVYGYKPTYGLVSRHGVLSQSPPLDQVGFFAHSIEDLALVAEPLMAFDERDPAMRPMARAELTRIAGEEPPVTPHIGFTRTPVWDQAEASTKEALAELVEALGDDVEEVALAEPFDKVVDWHRVIMEADLAKNFAGEYARGADRLSAILREMIERGQHYLAVDYNRAFDWIRVVDAMLDEAFRWNDVLLTPATIGPAPASLDSTGSPIFCTLWTYLGVPTVSLPLFRAENGMPFGAQLVGRRGDDARLLRTARWLVERVEAEATE